MKYTTYSIRYFLLLFLLLSPFIPLFAQIDDEYYNNNYYSRSYAISTSGYEGQEGYYDYDGSDSYYAQRFIEYFGPDSLFRTAVAAYYTGRSKEAEALYEKALKAGGSKAYYDFSDYFSGQGEIELYKKHIARWMKDRPQAKAPYMHQADIYKDERSFDKAVAVYESLIAKHTDYGSAYTALITLYKELGKKDLALKTAEKYAKVNFQDEQAYTELAFMYAQLNKTDDAIRTYEKAMTLFPKSASFHYSLSMLYREKGNSKRADELLEQYNSKFRTSSAQAKTTAYNFLTELSSASSTELAKLIKEYEAKAPKSTDENDLLILAGLYQITGEYGKAAGVLEKGIRAGVKTDLMYRTLAAIYDDVKNYEGLIRCYEALAAGDVTEPKKDELPTKDESDDEESTNDDSEGDENVVVETVPAAQDYVFRPYRSGSYYDYYGNKDRSYYKLQIAGIYQESLKNSDKAIKIMEELVASTEKDSDDYNTYVIKLGEMYERTGHRNDALALYERDPKKFEYKLLQLYRDMGSNNKVIAYYENKLKKDPKAYDAYAQLGAAYLNISKPAEAEAAYKKYVEKSKESTESLNTLAEFYEATNSYDKATKIYADLLDRAYKNAEDQYVPEESVKGLASLYLKIGKPEEAVKVYERFLQVNPQNFEMYDRVYSIYKKQLKNFDKALDAFEKRSQVCTTYPEEDYKRQLELADLYEKFKKFDKAIVVYQNLIRAKNKGYNSYESSYYYDGGAMNRLLGLYYILGSHKEAEAYLLESIKKNPKNSLSLRAALGDYYKKVQMYEKAIPLYEALIDETINTEKNTGAGTADEVSDDVSDDSYEGAESDMYYGSYTSSSVYAYMQALSDIYLRMHLYDKAAEVYLKRIKGEKASDAVLYAKAAEIYAANEDKKYWEKAADCYQKAIAIDDNPTNISGLVRIYTALERYDEAIKLVNRLITNSRKDQYNYYYYWYTLSELYEKKGNYDLALEALDTYEREYKKLYPEITEYTYYISQRAYLYARKAASGPEAEKAVSSKTAVELINKSLKMSKNSSSELYNAACIYAIIGNKKEALSYLEKALAAGFDNEEHVAKDKDMDTLRNTEEFKKLIKKYFGE